MAASPKIAEVRPLKRTKLDFADHITVVVGEIQKEFMVHEKIVCEASRFFTAACSGKWLESEQRKVRLPEQQPSSFAIYLHWLYCSEVDLWDGEEREIVAKAKSKGQAVKITPA